MSEQPPHVSPEAYPLAIEVGSIGIWEWDPATDTAIWSPAWSSLLGWPVADLPTTFRGGVDLAHPDDRAAMERDAQALLGGAALRHLEYRLRHADGGWRTVRGSATTVRGEDGSDPRMVLAVVDVTAERRTARTAQLREDLGEVVRRSAAALLTADEGEVDGVVRAGVGRLAALLGADRGALLLADGRTGEVHERFAWAADGDPEGAPALDSAAVRWLLTKLHDGRGICVSHREHLPDDADAVRTQMQALSLEALFMVPVVIDGRLAAVKLLSARRTEWMEETAPALQAFADSCLQALTRRRLEGKLREAHRHLEHLIDRAPLTMWRLSAEGDTLDYLSPNTEHFLGVEAEIVRHDWMDRLHPDDLETAIHALGQIRAGHESEFEARFRHADGRWLPFQVFVRPDDVGDNAAGGAVGYSLDITQRKAAEARLRRAERLEAIGQLAGGIAHDFNNLLTVMHGYMELARGGEAGALDEALTAAERGRTLVERLLTFSRQSDVEPVSVDLGAVLRSMESMIRLIGAGIEVRFDLPGELPPITADVGQLEQAVLNLVVNARDAMPTGGTLTLTADVPSGDDVPSHLDGGTYVRLRVADTGVGMAPDVEARALEPFFTTKAEGHGTGLGLAAVHGALTTVGGAVHLETAPGEGTTVHLFFEVAADAPEGRGEAASGEAARPARAATVLLVEDQPQIGELVRIVLQREGYAVLVAEDGVGALAVVEGHEVDLLLTDIAMPQMSGPELARTMRSTRPDLRVLYMSGYVGDALAGDDQAGFLQKPFKIADLVAATTAAIGGSPPHAE